MRLRRKSRELALQILFQNEFHENLNIEKSLALYRESFDSSPEVWEYTKTLVKGVKDNLEQIDKWISTHSKNWKMDRLSKVDKNILRIACYELKFLDRDVPPSVVINESIEIGKEFSSEDSASFLNAVLDNIYKAN